VKPLASDLQEAIEMALLRAKASRRPFDEAKVREHATIDCRRRRAVEKRRQRCTRRIDDLIEEPATPSFLDKLLLADEALCMLRQLHGAEREVMRLWVLREHSRSEVADILGLAPDTVTRTRDRALKRLRQKQK